MTAHHPAAVVLADEPSVEDDPEPLERNAQADASDAPPGETPHARRRRQRVGLGLAATAAILWGTQFPIAKSLFDVIDPYTLTAVRCGVAALGFVAVLAVVEGRQALTYGGRFPRAAVAGTFSMVIGVLVFYVGLQYTEATVAAVIVATQPGVAALYFYLRVGRRPHNAMLLAMATAFCGVALVVTQGHPEQLFSGNAGWGILLVVAGQIGWLWYAIEATAFRDWSPLRYCALTSLPGAVAVVSILGVATLAGFAQPSLEAITSAPLELAFSVVATSFLAYLAWSFARRRIDFQTMTMVGYLTPITTFALVTLAGRRIGPLELIGAAVALGGLAVYQRLDGRLGSAAIAASASSPPR